MKITGGTPGAGKVLTSDANGLATWQAASGIPSGAIVMWSGALTSIPAGWALCDGTSGTPDLRDRFIYGCSAGQDPGATDGATTHKHIVPVTRHTGYNIFAGNPWGQTGSEYDIITYASGNSYTGTARMPYSSPESHLPPYYKLAFIMKL